MKSAKRFVTILLLFVFTATHLFGGAPPAFAAEKVQFIHGDHINSSNVVTDSSGSRVALYEYDPYGNTVTHKGSASVKHQFTGQERDESAKLYYYGARYYDPQLGRFITSDPIVKHPADPQDLNHYAYARNNPVIYTDPTGNFWFIAAIIGAIVGAVSAGIQSHGNFKAMLIGAGIGFVAGAAGGVAGHAAGGGWLGAIVGGTAGGSVAGGLNAAVYGGDVGQGILRGAGFGALGGLAFGGINAGFDKFVKAPGFRWEMVRVGLEGTAGGGLSKLSGGKFWEGVAFSSAIAGSRFLYEVSTSLKHFNTNGENVLKTSNGGWAKKGGNATHPYGSGPSDFGRKIGESEKPDWFKSQIDGESAPLMRAVSQHVPGMEGTAYLHDTWQGAIGSRNAFVDGITNFPTMAPAAAVTYLTAANDPSMMGTFELYDKNSYKR